MLNKTGRDLKWKQDLHSLTVEVELKRTALKKITVRVGRRFLRVTCPEKSFAKVIDLCDEVKLDVGCYKVDYDSDWLVVNLQKHRPKIWDSLWVEGLSREEIAKRREDDLQELEKIDKDRYEEQKTTRQEQGSLVVKESMKINENKMQFLEQKKKDEKSQALKDIFGDDVIDEKQMSKDKVVGNELKNSGTNTQALTEKGQNTDKDLRSRHKASKKANEIWDESAIVSTEGSEKKQDREMSQEKSTIRRMDEEKPDSLVKVPKVLPAVRAPTMEGNVKLDFTERIFPTLAMRESQLKEAPAPKLRQLAKKADKNPENTLKSPIWLKDKGDELLQNGDYISAIDAYTSSLRLDASYWPALSNRSICHLKLHNVDDCMADCNSFLAKAIDLQKDNKMTPMLLNIREKVYLRSLVCYALKGEFGHYEELAELLIREKFLQEDQKAIVRRDLEIVKARKDTAVKKEQADELLKTGQYEQAAESYRKLIEEHSEEGQNERVLSNLSLCELKLDHTEACVDLSSQVIDIILKRLSRHFAQYDKSKHNDYYKSMLVKSYYRRSQSYFKLDKITECEESLREILLIDEKNEEARSLKRAIEKKRNLEEAQTAKSIADGLLKAGNTQAALDSYKLALTKFDQNEQPVEYASVLLNMTVCHTTLDQVDEVISDCIKGLRVTGKQSRAVIKLEKTRLTSEEQQKLTQLELRFYMRKGNAFLKKGQIYHAKADFEEAMKLAPDNKEIRQSLDKIALL